MPNREANFARAVEVRDFRDAKQLFWSDLANGNSDADVVKTLLLLRIDSDVGVVGEGRSLLGLVLRAHPRYVGIELDALEGVPE